MEDVIYQDKLLYPEILWERPVHYYKAQAGKAFLLAGSKGTAGTAILSLEAIFRSGTGILTLGFPDILQGDLKNILPEAMALPLPSTLSGSIAKAAHKEIVSQVKSCDVCVLGPGLSTNAETTQLIWELAFEIEKPVILEADGVTAFARGIEVMRGKESLEFLDEYMTKRKGDLVIAVRPGEVEKIIKAGKFEEFKDKKIDLKYVEAHKRELTRFLAEKLNAIVILSDNETVISQKGERLVVNRSSGEEIGILAGMIGSFMAQNSDKMFEAICTAAYLYGKVGEIAKKKIGDRKLIASDIIRYLPEAIKGEETD